MRRLFLTADVAVWGLTLVVVCLFAGWANRRAVVTVSPPLQQVGHTCAIVHEYHGRVQVITWDDPRECDRLTRARP